MSTIQRGEKVTVLDYEDSLRLLSSGFRVHFTKSGYIMLKEIGNKKSGFYYLHRWIMNAGAGEYVDHINRDKLDNRRSNLRITTQSMNRANSAKSGSNESQYKGICWHRHKWRARVVKEGKYYHCGYYSTQEEAARAYDKKALALFGEYAKLNFEE